MTETGAVTSPATGPNRRTQVLTGSVGHLVEYFDWSAYSFLAIYFSRQFFPGDAESVVPLLATFTVFAVGFLARPVGGILMGRMADRYGRKPTLAVGVAMMGLGSLLIGVAPTYAQVGILAPVILVVARLIQGLSTGGELSTATAFLVESAPAGRRGAYGSIVNVGSSLGKVLCLLAITLLVGTVGADAMADWAWRVPFLLGAVLAVVAGGSGAAPRRPWSMPVRPPARTRTARSSPPTAPITRGPSSSPRPPPPCSTRGARSCPPGRSSPRA